MNEFKYEALKNYLQSYNTFNYLLKDIVNKIEENKNENIMEKLEILKTNHSLQESFLKRMGLNLGNKEEELREEIKKLKSIIEDKSENVDINSASSYLNKKSKKLISIFEEIGIYAYPKMSLNNYGQLECNISILGEFDSKQDYYKTEEKYIEELQRKERMKKNLFNNFTTVKENKSIYIESTKENLDKIRNFILDLSNESEFYNHVKFSLRNNDENEFYINEIIFIINSVEAQIINNKFKNFRS